VSARCLIADDHPALLQAVSEFLEASGFELVASAPDGVRAVALARETNPDAAVVDFRMPRLAGIELIAQLREATPETRIVVYTAEADEAVVRAALGAGASAILLKESPLADLTRALEATLAGSTYLDPALAGFAVGAEVSRPMLTERESQVLVLLAEGLSHEEIGARLSISPETVRTHVRKACDRLGASTRTQAVAKALRLGLMS
jgi:two-component system, NarL family, nitrate/nitrite response regulator NarL